MVKRKTLPTDFDELLKNGDAEALKAVFTVSCFLFYFYHKKEINKMIESRCGILCGECNYREQMNCKGCISIDKPFWGEACPIKTCCEKKGKEHCGICEDFPCGLLKQFAYDEKQGDGGKRIEQCKRWCNI